MYTCIYVYMCICVYVYMYICTYVHMYIYIYLQLNTLVGTIEGFMISNNWLRVWRLVLQSVFVALFVLDQRKIRVASPKVTT